jgi:4-alpha-glucanotransferase
VDKAFQFVDFLSRTRQKIWQVLPLTQVDSILSPYASPDSIAGNHLLIDLKKLDRENILSTDEWESIKNKDKNEFIKNKEKLLFFLEGSTPLKGLKGFVEDTCI